MTEILKVGKYSGKQFQWIMENDIEYCKNILQMRIVSSAILPFKKYLKKKSLFDIPSSVTNCSNLAKLYSSRYYFEEIIKKMKSTMKKEKIPIFNTPEEFSPQDAGTFIDYYFRYELSQIYNIPFDDGRCQEIINKQYFSDSIHDSHKKILKEIKNSYEKMKLGVASIKDILLTSYSHSIWFGRNIETINLDSLTVPQEIILEDERKKYFESFKKKEKNLLLNPVLSSAILKIAADADIITDSSIIDIKHCSSIVKPYFIQLIIYASLYFLKCPKKKISSVEIINTKLGEKIIFSIDDQMIKETLKILFSRVGLDIDFFSSTFSYISNETVNTSFNEENNYLQEELEKIIETINTSSIDEIKNIVVGKFSSVFFPEGTLKIKNHRYSKKICQEYCEMKKKENKKGTIFLFGQDSLNELRELFSNKHVRFFISSLPSSHDSYFTDDVTKKKYWCYVECTRRLKIFSTKQKLQHYDRAQLLKVLKIGGIFSFSIHHNCEKNIFEKKRKKIIHTIMINVSKEKKTKISLGWKNLIGKKIKEKTIELDYETRKKYLSKQNEEIYYSYFSNENIFICHTLYDWHDLQLVVESS